MFHPAVKSGQEEDISILVKVDNHPYHYLCECGEASGLSVRECQNIRAVFLSHTHIDHFINFDTLIRHQIGNQQQVVVCGPIGLISQVQHRLKSYTWNLIAEDSITYEVREIGNDGIINRVLLKPPHWHATPISPIQGPIVYENDLFAVYCTVLDHGTDSVAYLFKAHDTAKANLNESKHRPGKWVGELKLAYVENRPEATMIIDGEKHLAHTLFHLMETQKGQTLGIIMDHAASEENHQKIAQTFGQCDKVYIECFYKNEDQTLATKHRHSYTNASGKIMQKCQVKVAIPVHFSRKYSPTDIEALIAEFEAAFQAK